MQCSILLICPVSSRLLVLVCVGLGQEGHHRRRPGFFYVMLKLPDKCIVSRVQPALCVDSYTTNLTSCVSSALCNRKDALCWYRIHQWSQHLSIALNEITCNNNLSKKYSEALLSYPHFIHFILFRGSFSIQQNKFSFITPSQGPYFTSFPSFIHPVWPSLSHRSEWLSVCIAHIEQSILWLIRSHRQGK